MERNRILDTLNHAYFSDHPDEERVMRALPDLIRGTRRFVDLGASLGQFTRLAAQTLKGAEIIAVEADPLRFEELRANCGKWAGESGNRVSALHAAVAASEGAISFQVTNSPVSGGLFRHQLTHLQEKVKDEVRWQEVEVKAVTLDSLFPDEPPDFIKMDIEGAELLALQGASRLLVAGRTVWLIELHDFAMTGHRKTAELVMQLMKEKGYAAVDYYDKQLFLRHPWRRVPGRYLRTQIRHMLRAVKRAFKALRQT